MRKAVCLDTDDSKLRISLGSDTRVYIPEQVHPPTPIEAVEPGRTKG